MIDGVFIHYLVNELKKIENLRINKIGTITNSEFYLQLSNKEYLLVSVNSNHMNIRLSKSSFVNSTQKNNFHVTLKKHLESSFINKISQYENDRIIIIDITSFDELGYENKLKLIVELFGRNSNVVLTDSNYIIIDAYKRCIETESNDRLIIPKATYKFVSTDKLNPFIENRGIDFNKYQGVSTLLYNEIVYKNDLNVINRAINPVFIEGNKNNFYCFDLEYLSGKRTYFNSLSSLLEYYFTTVKTSDSLNNEQLFLNNYINKEIHKINNKLEKQQNELNNALDDLHYEKLGNLLLSNTHLYKKNDKSITVIDYYNDNNSLTINLNPLLNINQNATVFFKKYQKAKRAIDIIKNQIEKSKNDLSYYNTLLNQLSNAKINDILEMYDELNIKGNNTKRAKSKPNFLVYKTKNDDFIYVGKNNIQNNYLTHSFANKNDYFFHVQNVPGSHVIVRTKNLSSDLIYLAACIASYHSSYKASTNVCVDYTLVKYVKKIPEQKGSFVTYKNHKSVFGKPDIDFINANKI